MLTVKPRTPGPALWIDGDCKVHAPEAVLVANRGIKNPPPGVLTAGGCGLAYDVLFCDGFPGSVLEVFPDRAAYDLELSGRVELLVIGYVDVLVFAVSL